MKLCDPSGKIKCKSKKQIRRFLNKNKIRVVYKGHYTQITDTKDPVKSYVDSNENHRLKPGYIYKLKFFMQDVAVAGSHFDTFYKEEVNTTFKVD